MASEKWDFDLVHTINKFWVRHMMVSKVHGHFTIWARTYAMDETESAKSCVEVHIEAPRIHAREPHRDSHLRSPDFLDAEKHRPPFRLLSDRGGEFRKRFGVPTTLGFIDGRVTCVIDEQGVIRHVSDSQLRPRQSVEEALRLVRSLKGSASAPPSEASNRAEDGSRL